MSELVRVAVWTDLQGFFRKRALEKTLFPNNKSGSIFSKIVSCIYLNPSQCDNSNCTH